MSFILEALRKSEAERRRGQAPQLFDAPAPLPASRPAPVRADWRWGTAALVALLVALLWWRGAPRTEATLPASRVASPVDSGYPQPQERSDERTSARPGRAPGADQPPALTSAPSSIADTPPAAAPAPPRPSAEAPMRPEPSREASTSTPESAPVPTASTRAPDPLPARAASTPSVAPTAETRFPAPAQPAADEPVRLAELSSAERTALPPLRMSMHMWAPSPADRFVILDGSRVGEGDRVGAAVVEAIIPDGAVLAWQGRRIKVPVR